MENWVVVLDVSYFFDIAIWATSKSDKVGCKMPLSSLTNVVWRLSVLVYLFSHMSLLFFPTFPLNTGVPQLAMFDPRGGFGCMLIFTLAP